MTPLIAKYNSLNKILDAKERKRMCRVYMAWLRENHPGCELHHLRLPNNAGTGIKPIDLYCVPLSNIEHRMVHNGKYKNSDYIEKLKKLHSQYMNEKGI